MDYLELGESFINNINKEIQKEYGVVLTKDTSFYNLETSEGTVTISFTGLSTRILNKEKGFYEVSEFMPRLGEIATFCELSLEDEDTLKILHERLLRLNNDTFVVISSGALLDNLDEIYKDGSFFLWPYKVILPTYEETLFALCKKGPFSLKFESTNNMSAPVEKGEIVSLIMREKTKMAELLSENRAR